MHPDDFDDKFMDAAELLPHQIMGLTENESSPLKALSFVKTEQGKEGYNLMSKRRLTSVNEDCEVHLITSEDHEGNTSIKDETSSSLMIKKSKQITSHNSTNNEASTSYEMDDVSLTETIVSDDSSSKIEKIKDARRSQTILRNEPELRSSDNIKAMPKANHTRILDKITTSLDKKGSIQAVYNQNRVRPHETKSLVTTDKNHMKRTQKTSGNNYDKNIYGDHPNRRSNIEETSFSTVTDESERVFQKPRTARDIKREIDEMVEQRDKSVTAHLRPFLKEMGKADRSRQISGTRLNQNSSAISHVQARNIPVASQTSNQGMMPIISRNQRIGFIPSHSQHSEYNMSFPTNSQHSGFNIPIPSHSYHGEYTSVPPQYQHRGYMHVSPQSQHRGFTQIPPQSQQSFHMPVSSQSQRSISMGTNPSQRRSRPHSIRSRSVGSRSSHSNQVKIRKQEAVKQYFSAKYRNTQRIVRNPDSNLDNPDNNEYSRSTSRNDRDHHDGGYSISG